MKIRKDPGDYLHRRLDGEIVFRRCEKTIRQHASLHRFYQQAHQGIVTREQIAFLRKLETSLYYWRTSD